MFLCLFSPKIFQTRNIQLEDSDCLRPCSSPSSKPWSRTPRSPQLGPKRPRPRADSDVFFFTTTKWNKRWQKANCYCIKCWQFDNLIFEIDLYISWLNLIVHFGTTYCFVEETSKKLEYCPYHQIIFCQLCVWPRVLNTEAKKNHFRVHFCARRVWRSRGFFLGHHLPPGVVSWMARSKHVAKPSPPKLRRRLGERAPKQRLRQKLRQKSLWFEMDRTHMGIITVNDNCLVLLCSFFDTASLVFWLYMP